MTSAAGSVQSGTYMLVGKTNYCYSVSNYLKNKVSKISRKLGQLDATFHTCAGLVNTVAALIMMPNSLFYPTVFQ